MNLFAVQEGILDLNFALQPQACYTIDSEASEINLSIADNPDSKIQVTLTNLDEFGEPSPPLVESEGTVSIHTFNVSSALPEEGLTVSVSAPSLDDFNLDAIEVTGGTIANVSDDGFDLTITEQTTIVSLPVLDDGVTEGSETATFTLIPNDLYEVNQELTEATFILADTLDEVSVPVEIEGNDTLAEANALGLTTENSTVSLAGQIDAGFNDPSEDVDLYTFNLEAGQTVSLDIDSSEWNTVETLDLPVVFPALDDVQNPDTELRLFDADGNELAANNDGAAPDEEFSRDPYLEYTAESAGTYYVGVSQLGNDNYNPNVARSGSGWTFPEVGVFFGPYELTASIGDGSTEPVDPVDPIDPTEPVESDFEPVFGSIDGDTIEVEGNEQLIFAGDMNDLVDATTGEGHNRIYAGSGDDTLILGESDRILAGVGDDAIFATSGGDNIITGGEGADQFWIASAELPDSANIITDFAAGEDVIGLAGLGIGFEDVTLTQQDSDALIGTDGNNLALLVDVSIADISSDNFVFG
ncbi:MAG: DVUA0089 family protein [Pleurocapsa sp.]